MAVKSDVGAIVKTYHILGGISKTAKALGLSRNTVSRWLHASNIPTPKSGPKSRIEEARVSELYLSGKSTRDISAVLGVGKTRVQYITRKLGISRSKSTSVSLSIETGRRKIGGVNHPNWNGGRTKRNGYMFVYAPEHPRSTSVRHHIQEHILVWENTHKQYLPEGFVIHHKNGIKTDNRPENLVALRRGKHHSKLLLLEAQKRIRALEATNTKLRKALEDNQLVFNVSEPESEYEVN